ncbi:hypothetical protein FVEG_06078 [Fusarium verticillioides 7600]|uniref:Uncharacterized protein n=1 Tax=Gibberella moniliformis (strain M3125 / FGSC 7600) TaxID=334819 RepID=W7M0S4_GIBM7|nr:hypothetical protein FVEG_06078 [Fusarium verticillioides 7600]EWG45173.1 hypothetical protein FVEG_06078 [Fusarium verticillioides 7600]
MEVEVSAHRVAALASCADVPSLALSKFSSSIVLFHCVSMALHQSIAYSHGSLLYDCSPPLSRLGKFLSS